METKSIFEIVRQLEDDDKQGLTTISEYVQFSLRQTIERINAYLNSKHISGAQDSMKRDKPFFNIVTAASNIWYRATDIDRKNIQIRATKESDTVNSFLATLLLQKYMRKTAFGQFLNEWGRVLARYGSAVVKFVEKDGELNQSVVDWNTIICDPVDFENNAVVEKLWLTPAQLLKNKNYDQDLVEKLLDATTTRKTSGGMNKDNKSDYIPVYEVHGELPLSLLTDKESDEDTYVQQMHVMTFLEKKDKGKGFDDYTLYSGREAKSPYMITHLIKEDGRAIGIGAVEHLFEAQWMMNHTQKQMKDQLDLASKLIFQTSDGNFVGQNALTNIENGDILIHTLNNPLTQINNKPDIVAMQSFGQQWQAQGNSITNVSESMQGQNAPSGTAWRQTEALLAESHSLFELMTENKGLYIVDMITEYILPNLKKKMDTTEEIAEILEQHQIDFIDKRYLPAQVTRIINDLKKKTILSGQIYDPMNEPMDTAQAQGEVQGQLDAMGSQRFIKPSDIKTKTWKVVMKDIEWELDIDITGEAVDSQKAMATYDTALKFIMGLQGRQMTNEEKTIFNKLISTTGVLSPIELSGIKTQPSQPTPMQVPTMAQGVPPTMATQ